MNSLGNNFSNHPSQQNVVVLDGDQNTSSRVVNSPQSNRAKEVTHWIKRFFLEKVVYQINKKTIGWVAVSSVILLTPSILRKLFPNTQSNYQQRNVMWVVPFIVVSVLATIFFIKNIIKKCTTEDTTMTDRAEKQIGLYKEDIAKLESAIADFDNFVLSNPELKRIFTIFAVRFSHYIATTEPIKEPGKFETVFDEMCYYGTKKIDLKFLLDQRKKFVERHREVYDCFIKHLNNNRNHQPVNKKLLSIKN